MKRFTIPADFNGQKHPFHVYIGRPTPDLHPLQFQRQWLKEQRGGEIPDDVMESFGKLLALALENSVSFEDLCVYALGESQKTAEEPATVPAEPSGDDPG